MGALESRGMASSSTHSILRGSTHTQISDRKLSMGALEFRGIAGSSTHVCSSVIVNRAVLQPHCTTTNFEATSLHNRARALTQLLPNQLRPWAFHGGAGI